MRNSLSLHIDTDVNYKITTSGNYVWIEASIPGSIRPIIFHCPSIEGIERLGEGLAEAKEALRNLLKDSQ